MLRLERLVDLFAALQDSQVGSRLVGRLTDAGEGGEYLCIDFARIGLARNGIALAKSHFLGDEQIEGFDLRVVAVKEGQKASLRAGRPFGPAEFEAGEPVLDLLQVEYQVVAPKRGPLADRRRLGRLQMGEAEARQVAVRGGISPGRRWLPPAGRGGIPILRASGSDRCYR